MLQFSFAAGNEQMLRADSFQSGNCGREARRIIGSQATTALIGQRRANRVIKRCRGRGSCSGRGGGQVRRFPDHPRNPPIHISVQRTRRKRGACNLLSVLAPQMQRLGELEDRLPQVPE